MGSLAGAAHLLNNNAGVLWRAQTERKSVVEQKGKSSLNDDFQYEYSLRNHGLSILSLNLSSMICIVRGVRKVTTGIKLSNRVIAVLSQSQSYCTSHRGLTCAILIRLVYRVEFDAVCNTSWMLGTPA